MKFLIRKRGFTLIEAMLYLVIVGTFLLAAMMFSLQIVDNYKLSENLRETQINAMIPVEKIVDAIHLADSVNEASSVFDDDNGVLVLNLAGSTVSFYLDGGNIYMKEGAAAGVKLNSSNVTVSALRFHQIKSANTPTQIVISGQVDAVSTMAGLQHSFPFHISASLRKL
ncbi:MAG: type II secretion system protein [Candidatus Gracilibacteria bacterium]